MPSPELRKVLESMRVPLWSGGRDSGVYVLGCLDRRVTLYSQQVRALNLAAALFDQTVVKPGDEVLVVGAGAAGLTCAAGLTRLGAKVVVLEKQRTLLPIFASKPQRWLHPNVYEWPFHEALRDKADLPVMTWTQGLVADVVDQLREGWREFDDSVSVISGVRDVEIGEDFVTWNPNGNSNAKVVVLAVGFGLEPKNYQGDKSYWEVDELDSVANDGTTTKLAGIRVRRRCVDRSISTLYC